MYNKCFILFNQNENKNQNKKKNEMPNTGYFKVASVLKLCLFLVSIRNSVFFQVSITSFFVLKNSFSRQIYKIYFDDVSNIETSPRSP